MPGQYIAQPGRERRVLKVLGPADIQVGATRDFTPSREYRHLLSPETLASLLEWESSRDMRAENEAERNAYSGVAKGRILKK